MVISMIACRELRSLGHAPDQPDGRLPIQLSGIVVEGDHRGRELGYPTANVEMPTDLEVLEGVFAGIVRRADGSVHRSAISVGRRETFYGANGCFLIEAFLLDFADDLYGERITVTLVALLRGQERFDSIPGLIAQVEIDVDAVRRTIDPGTIAL